jgi:mycofactocin system glycosyltransferase
VDSKEMNTSGLTTDDQWFRSENGSGLLAGSPLTYFSVTDAGQKILDAIESNEPLPVNHAGLTQRLLAKGAVHPVYDTPGNAADLTVVIPSYVSETTHLERLQTLVDSLAGLHLIVVDDCSPIGIVLSGAEVIRLPTNQGPATARNAGLNAVTTAYVAFVDDDTSVTAHQLLALTSHFTDMSVDVVAPRVASTSGDSLVAEYETFHSPLDLGLLPSVVRPLSRVSYVPAAVLIARTHAVIEMHAFDTSMRLGEDVDLIWRIVEEGRTVRYDPTVICHHAPRMTIRALLKQRFGYGRSAASLDRKHPFTAAPLRANIVMLIPAIALLSGYVFVAAALVPLMLMWFSITLRQTKIPLTTRAKLAMTGWFSTVRLLTSAVMRVWWPPVLLVGQFSLRVGAVFVFSAFVPAMYGLMRNKPRHTVGYIALRILDPMAYGVGVWTGAIRDRNLRCLLPVVTRSSIRLRSKV